MDRRRRRLILGRRMWLGNRKHKKLLNFWRNGIHNKALLFLILFKQLSYTDLIEAVSNRLVVLKNVKSVKCIPSYNCQSSWDLKNSSAFPVLLLCKQQQIQLKCWHQHWNRHWGHGLLMDRWSTWNERTKQIWRSKQKSQNKKKVTINSGIVWVTLMLFE